MGELTVVYDACVLYPAPLRSLLMYLAMTGLYRARWSDAIHEEWMRNVELDFPDIDRAQVERIRDLMNLHVSDCLVVDYESLIPSVVLPDPDDRHVLAAAIHCEADLILTFNLKDFPDDALAPYGISANHPDDFLMSQTLIAPQGCLLGCQAAAGKPETTANVRRELPCLAGAPRTPANRLNATNLLNAYLTNYGQVLRKTPADHDHAHGPWTRRYCRRK